MTHPHNPNKKQSKLAKAKRRLAGRIAAWNKFDAKGQTAHKKPGSMQMP